MVNGTKEFDLFAAVPVADEADRHWSFDETRNLAPNRWRAFTQSFPDKSCLFVVYDASSADCTEQAWALFGMKRELFASAIHLASNHVAIERRHSLNRRSRRRNSAARCDRLEAQMKSGGDMFRRGRPQIGTVLPPKP